MIDVQLPVAVIKSVAIAVVVGSVADNGWRPEWRGYDGEGGPMHELNVRCD